MYRQNLMNTHWAALSCNYNPSSTFQIQICLIAASSHWPFSFSKLTANSCIYIYIYISWSCSSLHHVLPLPAVGVSDLSCNCVFFWIDSIVSWCIPRSAEHVITHIICVQFNAVCNKVIFLWWFNLRTREHFCSNHFPLCLSFSLASRNCLGGDSALLCVCSAMPRFEFTLGDIAIISRVKWWIC